MFALKSRIEQTIRVVLITAILFNALVPTAAFAQAAVGSLSSKGSKQSAYKISTSSRILLQDAPPTVSPTNVDIPTPSEAATSETTPIPSETLAPSATLEPSATSTPAFTQNPNETISPSTQRPTATQTQPPLSFNFSASPEQAAPGDEVIFTIEVVNNGRTPMTGLLFSNLLPQEFGFEPGAFRGFNFDLQTRLLTWNGAQAGVITLAPGQIVTLEYSVKIDAQLDEVQIVDSGTFSAAGYSAPLLAGQPFPSFHRKKT
jgi:uncharacterized repeat protein (TIGR01451 family)